MAATPDYMRQTVEFSWDPEVNAHKREADYLDPNLPSTTNRKARRAAKKRKRKAGRR